MLKSSMIYVLLFGLREEIIVSMASVKFSILVSRLDLYNAAVIMQLRAFRSAKIISILPRMKD